MTTAIESYTDELILALIDEIHSNPSTYDRSDPDYNHNHAKKSLYQTIAENLKNKGHTTKEGGLLPVKDLWKNILAAYLRVKIRNLRRKSGQVGQLHYKWKFEEAMRWYDPHAENIAANKMARKYKTDVSPTDGEFPFKHLVENGFAGVDSNENFSDDGDLGQETSSAQMTLDWLANYQCPSFNIDEPDIKTQDKNGYMNDNDHAQSLMEPNYNLPQQNGPAAKRKRTEQTISPSPNGVLGNSSANSEADIFGAFIANKLSWISSRNFKKACQLQKDLMEMVLKCQMEVFETQTNHDL